jgi:hypothetical protein
VAVGELLDGGVVLGPLHERHSSAVGSGADDSAVTFAGFGVQVDSPRATRSRTAS